MVAEQLAARTAQGTKDFQARYALRAGVEGTIRQAVAVTGIRKARYRGLGKTRLEHAHAAVAVNLIRLHAWWNGHPLDRTRTSHLARLELALYYSRGFTVSSRSFAVSSRTRPACSHGE